MTNLLFPTDFSTSSTAALDWVRLFARKTGATITLLHVYQPIVPDSTFPSVGDAGLGLTAAQEVEEISQQRLAELETELLAEGLSVRSEWRVGPVDDEVLDFAKQLPADLIVMGRSDLSTFFDRLAGSSASDVASESICPVLIVPTTPEGQAIRPAQVHTIAYAMQPQTTQSLVSTQTDSLVEAFGAQLSVLTDEQLDNAHVDLIVMQLYPQSGFLDKIFHPNHTARLVDKSAVPVLIYHEPK